MPSSLPLILHVLQAPRSIKLCSLAVDRSMIAKSTHTHGNKFDMINGNKYAKGWF